MSWTSQFKNLGRFSPFTRSPNSGPTKVSDSDFSYITADDLRRHQAESDKQHQVSESPTEYDQNRETDVLRLRSRRKEYTVHFPAYSITKGELNVGSLRDAAARKTNTTDSGKIKLYFHGRLLKDSNQTCKSEGLRNESTVVVQVGDSLPPSPSESDDEEDDYGEAADGYAAEGDVVKRRRNRGKKTKRRNKREAPVQGSGTSTPDPVNLGVPLSQASTRTASPKPVASPATPLDKLNALQATLSSFLPDCDQFLRHPPADPSKKEFEHKRLSETILTQVLLKLDAVETEGDAEARTRRKELVRETQSVLQNLDGIMKK